MDALLLATKAHHGQVRRNTQEPYIMHPIRVSKTLYEQTGDLRLTVAGLCHDLLEDTKITHEELVIATSSDIAELVLSVTKKPNLSKDECEREFLSRYRNSQLDTVLLKLADRADNVRDLKFQNQTFRDRYRENTSMLLAATPSFNYHPVVAKLVAIIKANIYS